jgi:hypothetical protein
MPVVSEAGDSGVPSAPESLMALVESRPQMMRHKKRSFRQRAYVFPELLSQEPHATNTLHNLISYSMSGRDT